MQLHGLHHVTAVTANAPQNLQFYTKVLELRLVKKTVNQDDVSAYHLFYADKLGTPGTDMTFFDWPKAGVNEETSDGITRTYFRVLSEEALRYWKNRLIEHGVATPVDAKVNSRSAIIFADHEGQKLGLIVDGAATFDGEPWTEAGVPEDMAIRGFAAVELTVPDTLLIHNVFTLVLNFAQQDAYVDESGESVSVYVMDGGGVAKEIYVREKAGRQGWLGAGGVHHVAFRIKDTTEQAAWVQRLNMVRVSNSGPVERFYFSSLYFRVTDGILFELATDGPGFSADESVEHLGEALSLPPFLEADRERIEAGLKPLQYS